MRYFDLAAKLVALRGAFQSTGYLGEVLPEPLGRGLAREMLRKCEEAPGLPATRRASDKPRLRVAPVTTAIRLSIT
jgi:hypothetical protein